MDPYDVRTLSAYRGAIDALDPRGEPVVRPVRSLIGSPRRVAILPGSFDPPTAAHLMLAERALREGYDLVLFALAKRTAGKGRGGLLLEDRLLALRAVATPQMQVVLSSHALYAEMAEAVERLVPSASLAFLVGSDKVFQIFDPDWYPDREQALDRLFARADVHVAPRSDQTRALQACLEDPANRRWARRVHTFRLHPAVCDLSSTHVRGMLRAGADPGGLVPPAVAAFLAEVRAFAPSLTIGAEDVDPYEVRARLLEHLFRLDGDLGDAIDLRALVSFALGGSPEAMRFREIVRGEAPEDVARAARAAIG